MNIINFVEFIFIIMILVFLAIFVIFIILTIEIYTFLTNLNTSFTLRIIILSSMAFVFLYILRGIISKAEDFHEIYHHE